MEQVMIDQLNMDQLIEFKESIKSATIHGYAQVSKIGESNKNLANLILLLTDKDITQMAVLSTFVMFIERYTKVPKVSNYAYNGFMCFDASPDETAEITGRIVEGLQKRDSYAVLGRIFSDFAGGDSDLFLYLHLVFLLIEHQCNINNGVKQIKFEV